MGTSRFLILASAVALAGAVAAFAPPESSAASQAPACTPGTLDESALLDGLVTVSPEPGSRDATPLSQISFLGVPAADLSSLTVIGTRSGVHTGRLIAYSQGDGASFLPSKPFDEGERVLVRAKLRVGGAVRPLSDEFAIADQDRLTTTPSSVHPGSVSEVQHFASRPDLRPPTVQITQSSPAIAPGDEFLAPYGGPGQSGPMIVEPDGALVWFKALPAYTFATDLQEQEYEGRPVLTWWQGDITVHGFGLGEDVIADQSYKDIAHVRAGNGLKADLHEFTLTPQGTALITAFEPIRCDLSTVGGPADGDVSDSVLQEIDVKTGLVMYQWTSLDHVPMSESHLHASNARSYQPFEYFHMNSISLDRDGSLLISARNTWTVYNLNPATGQINWQLGGEHSTFALGPEVATAWQHDSRELEDGAFTIFDNGSAPTVHGQSRGIVVAVNTQQKTATLIQQIVHTPPLISQSEGDIQALANGDWFLGFGQIPEFSEFSPQGALLFDGRFPAATRSYRDFRFSWTGTPAHPPAFAFKTAAGGAGTVYASWNGATEVAAWRVLSGPRPAGEHAIAQAARSGFETAIPLPGGSAGAYVSVQALNAAGAVIGTSAARRS